MKARILIFLLILATGIGVAWYLNKKHIEDPRNPNNRLKVYSPDDVNPVLVDDALKGVKKGHKIAPFSFVNQLGDTITEKDFEGKIYITDFFFTTCGSICPKMTKNLMGVQERFKKVPDVMILSHTVWPEVDSVEQLKRYADQYGIDSQKWHLVTGDKEELYKMARQSYLVVPDIDDESMQHEGDDETDFIHTENMVLIDPEGRIRGYYDGVNKNEMKIDLIKDILDLMREYDIEDKK